MKSSELRIVPYCDFHHPDRKVEAEVACTICGNDIYYDHDSRIVPTGLRWGLV